jgi:hypothetical protein
MRPRESPPEWRRDAVDAAVTTAVLVTMALVALLVR